MNNKVLGMWEPEYVRLSVGDKTTEPFGPNPAGLLCFHESLRFVVMLSDPRVPRFASDNREEGTAAENKAAMVGNLALFGTYRVSADGTFLGNTVEGCTFPNWIGEVRTQEQLQEIVEGDSMKEIFQSGETRLECLFKRRDLL